MIVRKAKESDWCDHTRDGFGCCRQAIVILDVSVTRTHGLCPVHCSSLISDIVKTMAEVMEWK